MSHSNPRGSSDLYDEEDWEGYVKGGYHPVRIGEKFSDGRYVVVRKLGWGYFSTVWLAEEIKFVHSLPLDPLSYSHLVLIGWIRINRHVAIKIVKSSRKCTETALEEIKLLECTSSPSRSASRSSSSQLKSGEPSLIHPGRSHVISFLDHFEHSGPNGTHVCMVFEVLGENLLGLIRRCEDRGVPTRVCKQIAKQVLLGLDFLHNHCGIIHTGKYFTINQTFRCTHSFTSDLKPENILVSIDDVEALIKSELRKSSQPTTRDSEHEPRRLKRGSKQTFGSNVTTIIRSEPLTSLSSFGLSSRSHRRKNHRKGQVERDEGDIGRSILSQYLRSLIYSRRSRYHCQNCGFGKRYVSRS